MASTARSFWSNIETKLGTEPTSDYVGFGFGTWRFQFAAVAAGLLIVATLGIWLLRRGHPPVDASPSWEVQRLDGALRVGESSIANKGKMSVGEWVETGKDSKAQINVASIGQVEIGPDTKVRLLQTQPTEHRLELVRGKMSARIWAPPRLFFVDTPSAVAADLGCAYTLEVKESGASLLRVTVGWVALQLKDRESMVPAGAACETRPGIGPGTPYFEDAAPEFRASLTKIDFDNDSVSTNTALDVLLSHTRKRDTLTLWHLLGRVDETERGKVYDKIASFVPPPAGVTREGILSLDQKMLDLWRDQVEPTWAVNTTIPKEVAEAYWRVKNGDTRNANDLQKKLTPVVP